MQIKWNNLIALALLVFAFVVGLRYLPQIGEFLATLSQVGPGGDPDQRTFGLMAFGLVLVLIVAVVKILTNRK